MNTLCRLCLDFLVYCVSVFHRQHMTPWQWSLINPFSSHCSFAITQVSFGGHTCECLLLSTVTSIMCWRCVDARERVYWLSGWVMRQGGCLLTFGPLLITPDAELSLELGGGPYHTRNPSWQSCPNHFISKYWGVTWVVSPYIPFIPTPSPPLFVFATFLFFLAENWFLDSLALYRSS